MKSVCFFLYYFQQICWVAEESVSGTEWADNSEFRNVGCELTDSSTTLNLDYQTDFVVVQRSKVLLKMITFVCYLP